MSSTERDEKGVRNQEWGKKNFVPSASSPSPAGAAQGQLSFLSPTPHPSAQIHFLAAQAVWVVLPAGCAVPEGFNNRNRSWAFH